MEEPHARLRTVQGCLAPPLPAFRVLVFVRSSTVIADETEIPGLPQLKQIEHGDVEDIMCGLGCKKEPKHARSCRAAGLHFK